ncbi:hypothetical protein UlMin_019835 [Ulmus minor]
MAPISIYLRSLIIFLTILTISSSPSPSPSPAPRHRNPHRSPHHQHPNPPSPPPISTPEQFNNIIETLIGASDFSNWISIIPSSILPRRATLFIPENDAVTRLPTAAVDPLTFAYHIVPHRLSFSELRLFSTNSRLPTLFPGKSILITNNSLLNFTIDGSPITHPDLYAGATITVHGIREILDYSVYGNGLEILPKPETKPQPEQQLQVVRSPAQEPVWEETDGWSSDAAPIHHGFGFLVVFVVLVFKIYRNSFDW